MRFVILERSEGSLEFNLILRYTQDDESHLEVRSVYLVLAYAELLIS